MIELKKFNVSLHLPQQLLKKLPRASQNILQLILDLMYYTSLKSKTKAVYCFPSQEWLAQKTGYSREWTSKCLNVLHEQELINITHRRKIRQRWQTNMYTIGRILYLFIRDPKEAFKAFLHRVNSTLHRVIRPYISNKKKEVFSSNSKSPPEELQNILDRLGRKLGFIND